MALVLENKDIEYIIDKCAGPLCYYLRHTARLDQFAPLDTWYTNVNAYGYMVQDGLIPALNRQDFGGKCGNEKNLNDLMVAFNEQTKASATFCAGGHVVSILKSPGVDIQCIDSSRYSKTQGATRTHFANLEDCLLGYISKAQLSPNTDFVAVLWTQICDGLLSDRDLAEFLRDLEVCLNASVSNSKLTIALIGDRRPFKIN